MVKMYEHQKRIIEENKQKTGLFLGTGSGKSFIAIHLARGKTLVICPKTIKENGTWEKEKNKWGLKLDLTTISKENFRKFADTLPPFETVIIDEAETCLGVQPAVKWVKKEPRPCASQLFDKLSEFLVRTSPQCLYLVTATITRSPMTVWAAGNLLGFDWNFYNWRHCFYYRLEIPGREIWIPRKDSATKDKLAKSVQLIGYVGRLEEYFDCPEQTYRTVYVDLLGKQREKIKGLSSEFPDPIVLIGKKHQVENGSLKGNEYCKTEYFDNEKIDKLKDFAIEFPRMIVYAKYSAQIEQIADAMLKIGKKVFILQGDTPNRGEMIAEANKCEDYVFICQAQIGAGWELPKCPVIVFASMSYSVVDRLQAEGRIHRANNLKKNLYITLVVRDIKDYKSVDNAVFNCIENKKDFNERIYI